MAEFSLDEILADDPLGLLDEAKAKTKNLNEDDRLLVSFEEINTFIEQEEHEPKKSANMSERNLFSRLDGIRQNPEKIEFLKPYDRFNILQEVKINSIDDILNDDVFGLLESENSDDIFTLKHVPKEREQTDFVAQRKPCKNFAKYEELFKEVQNDLKNGSKKLVKFNERFFEEGNFFVLKGVLAYLEKIKNLQKDKFNKLDARTKIIFENGTESNMLLRSFGKGLYEDGYFVSLQDDRVLDKLLPVSKDDTKSGYIYVLESLSNDDKISSIKNLYKIGYSTTDVKERIKNVIKESTYLMAPVRIVTVYEAYGMNTQKFEQLIHRFFGKVCLNVDIFSSDVKRYTPREWFILPLEIIEQVIELVVTGEIVNCVYDEKNKELVLKQSLC
ncbi:GIY-YIG nuclease family protein [Sulfurimonas sp.]|uniref:GIY-YIG nuclease family protein n=1 Tax=Sulfurimonas sp. TaxID=2022749 RepID=UPI0025DDC619|nr:GIY-YIG nuclease family protein [Sulfurimonas sp.]MBW6488782.1 GIY-YIG nuclease family protein [Sulfurimonas sp.]